MSRLFTSPSVVMENFPIECNPTSILDPSRLKMTMRLLLNDAKNPTGMSLAPTIVISSPPAHSESPLFFFLKPFLSSLHPLLLKPDAQKYNQARPIYPIVPGEKTSHWNPATSVVESIEIVKVSSCGLMLETITVTSTSGDGGDGESLNNGNSGGGLGSFTRGNGAAGPEIQGGSSTDKLFAKQNTGEESP